jgi:hypothetical protein
MYIALTSIIVRGEEVFVAIRSGKRSVEPTLHFARDQMPLLQDSVCRSSQTDFGLQLKTPLYSNVARPHCDAYSLILSGVRYTYLLS